MSKVFFFFLTILLMGCQGAGPQSLNQPPTDDPGDVTTTTTQQPPMPVVEYRGDGG